MSWWNALVLVGVAGLMLGTAGAAFTLLRLLPWGRNWDVGGYR